MTCKDYWGYLEYITSFKLNLLCNVPSSGLFTRWLPKSKRESRIQAGSLRAGPFLAGEQPLAFPPILRGFPASCLSQRQLGHPLRLAPRHAVLRVRGDRDPPPPLRGQPLSQPESSPPWLLPAESPCLRVFKVCASARSPFRASPVPGGPWFLAGPVCTALPS